MDFGEPPRPLGSVPLRSLPRIAAFLEILREISHSSYYSHLTALLLTLHTCEMIKLKEKTKVPTELVRIAQKQRAIPVSTGGSAPPVRPVEAGTGDGGVDRITFSAPASEGWPKRLEAARRKRGDRSTSETIRALLEEGLKP